MDPINETAPSSTNETVDQEALPQATSKKNVLLLTLLAVFVAALAFGSFFFFTNPKQDTPAPTNDIIRIGLSLDSVKIQRWSEERDLMIKKAESLGATLTVFSAENDDMAQVSQIQNLISQNVDVIIVVAHDSESIGPVLTEAQNAGIKVINYDRLTKNGAPDLYLSFDSTKVGEYAAKYVVEALPEDVETPNIAFIGGSPTDNNAYLVRDGAMSVLDPLIQEGKIKLVYSEFTEDWSPSEAYLKIKQFLNSGEKVDGIVASNDGLAYGAIQALTENGIAGSVPVSGQDGELQAIQRIMQGTQTVTIWKPGKLLAEKAIEAAVALASNEMPQTNGTVNNGTVDVPSYLFDPTPVTKDNVNETVIAGGVYTLEQIQ